MYSPTRQLSKEVRRRIRQSLSFFATDSIAVIPTGRLIYSRILINNSDELHLKEIAEDLKGFNCSLDNNDSVPVIIIGTLPEEKNILACTYNEENKDYILLSVFNLDADTEPKYFFSTNRIISAMNITGYRYNKPDVSNFMNEAYAEALTLPSYPNAGYIKETQNFVVVNLGNQ